MFTSTLPVFLLCISIAIDAYGARTMKYAVIVCIDQLPKIQIRRAHDLKHFVLGQCEFASFDVERVYVSRSCPIEMN